MTTDNFTEAARAEAERQFPAPLYSTAWSQSEVQIKRALWESGAEWARTHLAAEVERLAPAAVEHWRWSEKQRARHGDEGCVCTTCDLLRALRTIRGDEEDR